MQQTPEQPNKQPPKEPPKKEDEVLIQPGISKESVTPEPDKKEPIVEKSATETPVAKEQLIAKKIPFTGISKEVKKEKLDFLKHMDVRTMTKDVARLRRKEAEKERKRIENLASKKAAKVREEKDKTIADSLIYGDHAKTREIRIPRAPSRSDKLFIRVLVVLFLIFTIGNIIGFTYYYFFITDKTTAPQEQPPPAILVIPNSLITVRETIQSSFTQKEEIPQILSEMLDAQRENGFIRIVLKDSLNNKVIQLTEFFNAFNITSPPEILNLLEDDFTLFLYTNEGVKRLGLVAQGREGIAVAAIDWEQSLEQDTKELFDIIGEKGQGYIANFRTATIDGDIVARFQTLSLNNLGIVYGIVDNKFILTSSLQSIEDIIQELK